MKSNSNELPISVPLSFESALEKQICVGFWYCAYLLFKGQR